MGTLRFYDVLSLPPVNLLGCVALVEGDTCSVGAASFCYYEQGLPDY